ncbi:type I-B CRISPR-associated endonuclease Cas1b [Enterococcus saccharolyticus]|uniref:CRISPR-associated endonuclease Cas1 n=1 Tax=Enterococcus saccharolyticus subsp. saccharolyticus ATCC 43076 TaxID=1139996 RepID=S0NJU3_9ENTE|nr:type I-B CRISPR-associated endonuclease Cas1b [Enterococcus saccharolyticus]EOT28170.1 CRISPR-associated endonuclease cas1 [Enterococcus saccharolyticus subsp. saccharolyticus ATCC 43076]EOT81524.1 CRISPR-associated endonuclease cas1 [Enterococcus saccharolyticus subsp. saccharolyticus ATCC 43076]OJG87456.1 CRISPR-associated endonuclease cas1 [Enterococcus saccharolyticus]
MVESYYLFSSGELKRKDNVVRMTAPDGRFKDIKIEMTRDIYLFGETSMNTKCLNFLSTNKIPMHLFNYYGYYTGSFYPKEVNISGNLLIRQVEHYTDETRRLIIAKEIIYSASYNIYRNVRYYHQRGKDLETQLDQLKALRKLISRAKNIQELMGIEGNIHQVYYTCWAIVVNQKIDFQKRVKRPPDNMINTLISFLNSLVYTSCLSEIYVSQLNPTISYLHSASDRRFSLSLDIAEIFKPILVDRLIFSLLNKKVISESDFDTESNFCYLKKNAQQKILKAYNERLEKTIKHRELKRHISYRHLMRLECYKLIKHLMNDKNYEGFKIWW